MLKAWVTVYPEAPGYTVTQAFSTSLLRKRCAKSLGDSVSRGLWGSSHVDQLTLANTSLTRMCPLRPPHSRSPRSLASAPRTAPAAHPPRPLHGPGPDTTALETAPPRLMGALLCALGSWAHLFVPRRTLMPPGDPEFTFCLIPRQPLKVSGLDLFSLNP